MTALSSWIGARQLVTVADAIEFLRDRQRIVVVTGAGVSTDSGIPDYRGKGAPARTPMTLDEFMTSEQSRRRYWAGSHLGWAHFNKVRPNASHYAIAALQGGGRVSSVITQNVDALHERAGTTGVVHIHGTVNTVSCLRCGTSFPRADIANVLIAANGAYFAQFGALRPDGDADVSPGSDFVIPACAACGGLLKPDVVFFGETVDPAITDTCYTAVDLADALLVAGSSLVVNSGMKLVNRARKAGVPVVIVNRGETKADRYAAVRLEGSTAELLPAIADALR